MQKESYHKKQEQNCLTTDPCYELEEDKEEELRNNKPITITMIIIITIIIKITIMIMEMVMIMETMTDKIDKKNKRINKIKIIGMEGLIIIKTQKIRMQVK